MSDYAEHAARDARLCILRELSRQLDGRANETILAAMLAGYGHARSRDWVRTQIRKLEELGAVRVTTMGDILVPEITLAGQDHVERRALIEGVAKPQPSA